MTQTLAGLLTTSLHGFKYTKQATLSFGFGSYVAVKMTRRLLSRSVCLGSAKIQNKKEYTARSSGKRGRGLQDTAQDYLKSQLISHHDSCCHPSKRICLAIISQRGPVWLVCDIRGKLMNTMSLRIWKEKLEPARNINFVFIPLSYNKGRLHHRGVIHVNDVIMQYKFLFPPPEKDITQRQQDIVIYFLMAVLQLHVAAWTAIFY